MKQHESHRFYTHCEFGQFSTLFRVRCEITRLNPGWASSMEHLTPEWKLGYYQAAPHRKLCDANTPQLNHTNGLIQAVWGITVFLFLLKRGWVSGWVSHVASRSDSQPASLLAVKLQNQTKNRAAGDCEKLTFCSVTPDVSET